MMLEKRKKKVGATAKYQESLKIAVAKEWLKGEKGYGALAKEYGLESRNTARSFVIWYKKHHEDYENFVSEPLSEEEKEENAVLRKKLVELEAKNAEANLKIEALNTMIKLVENEYNIDVIKKSGSKQQTK